MEKQTKNQSFLIIISYLQTFLNRKISSESKTKMDLKSLIENNLKELKEQQQIEANIDSILIKNILKCKYCDSSFP